jgi:hypothetical protein
MSKVRQNRIFITLSVKTKSNALLILLKKFIYSHLHSPFPH